MAETLNAPRPANGLLRSPRPAGSPMAVKCRTQQVQLSPRAESRGFLTRGNFPQAWRPNHSANAVLASDEKSAQPWGMEAWPDAKLISAVRRDPPDEAALDTLVVRYWKPLFARCHLLVLERQKASDLAQETWCRVLRARHALKPDGNFPAYLMTIATNLWRDSNRSARRAGPMAEQRLASLDATRGGEEGEALALVDILPDLNSLQNEEQSRLKLDIDAALERLSPLLRDVLVARYIAGESAAEIGRRYNRTEQTASGWVREALRQMKTLLQDVSGGIPTSKAAP